MSFRDSIKAYSPPWLTRQWGERFVYTAGLELDAIAEAARQGIIVRAPGAPEAPVDALPQIAFDRVTVRGAWETNAVFAGRLSRSFDTWSRSGSAEGLMRSLQALMLDDSTPVKFISWAGIWASIGAWDGPIEYTQGRRKAWTWGYFYGESVPDYWDWAQVFVIVYPPSGRLERAELSDDIGAPVLGAEDWCIGFFAPQNEVQALRVVANNFRSATTSVRVIVSYDPEWPSHPTAVNPVPYNQASESWLTNHTVEAGVSVPSRYSEALYLDPVS